MEYLKTLPLTASRMDQMFVVVIQQISGMKKFCSTKIFQKILNWRMLKRKLKLLLKITDQRSTNTFQDIRTNNVKKSLIIYLKTYLHFSVDTEKDKQGFLGAVLMNLSKAIDIINHELINPKLLPYGFSMEALEVLLSYLQETWERVRSNTSFSSQTQLLQGFSQGSLLGPMFFNIFINDIFFALNKIDICALQMTQLHTFVIQIRNQYWKNQSTICGLLLLLGLK